MCLNEPCCRYCGEESLKLSHDKFCRPIITQLVWPNYGITQSPEHLSLPKLSSLCMNLRFLSLLPAKTLSTASSPLLSYISGCPTILSWLVTSLSTFGYKVQFCPGFLTMKASVSGYNILSLLRSTFFHQHTGLLHEIILWKLSFIFQLLSLGLLDKS